MSDSPVLFSLPEDGIATITLNRPHKLNALNRALLDELDTVLDRVAQDDAVRAAIVTGAGEKAFVAGADISEFQALSPAGMRAMALRGQRIFRKLETCGKPTIAAINGFALGGGMELALACSMRIASTNARMGQPEIKLGIIPGYGGTQRLPRLAGRGVAIEMLLTGEPVDAAEAYRIGLVNHVVEPAALLETAAALLRKILMNAPLAASLILEAVDTGLNGSLEDGLRFEAAAFAVAASTEDAREGAAAFLEKRKAKFSGK